jgi:hypothetical protein
MKTAERIAELAAELKRCQDKVKQLTTERDEALELVDRCREHVADADRMIEQWIEVFGMQQNDHGSWLFDPEQSALWDEHDILLTEYNGIVRQWNRFVPEYNAVVSPRERGRPLVTSPAQQAEVLQRRKAKQSLRGIAAAMTLSVRAVRTVVEKAAGRDRTGKRTNAVRRVQLNRLRAAAFRARKKSRERLPQAIDEQLKTGATLVKAAKGLGTRG